MIALLPILANDLPDPSPKEFILWLSCALLLVTILGGAFWTWNQAKEALGRKPPFDEEVEELKRNMVTKEALEDRLKGWATAIELKFEQALHFEFQKLNKERSTSIAGLHHKVETATADLHHRIHSLSEEMPGKIIRILKDTGHLE